MSAISRRVFLELAGVAAATAVVRPHPAPAAGKSLTVLHESSFIPPFDEYIKKTLADAYEKETGVKVVYEVTAVGSLPTRISTIAETGTGADITMNGLLQVIQFGEKYLEVTDLSKEIGDKNGGWYDAGREAVFVDGKWKAVPFCNIGQLMNWRTDWFAEVGFKEFPETWEELYEAGKKLKANDHPFGFELGHGFGDNHGWLYPLFWSYGGREVDKDGKTVLIDSDETAKAVDFCRRFYKETMFEDVLGWTDVSNNKAFFGEQISCTNNASSILVVGKRDFPEIAKVTDHGLNPQGPKGRFHLFNPVSHALMTHAPDPAACKAFLRWLYDDKQMSRWLASGDAYYAPFLHGYDNHPMWNAEPRYLPYKESLKTSRLHGWPGPASHALSESVAKYVLVDMFAKACRGDSTKDVIATAAAQLKQIYKAK